MSFTGQIANLPERRNLPFRERGFPKQQKESTSMSLLDLGGEENLETIPELIERARRERVVFEATHLRKNGSPIPVEVSLSTAMIQDEPMLLAIVRWVPSLKRRSRNQKGYRRKINTALAQFGGRWFPLRRSAPSKKQFVVAKADSTAHRLWVFRFMVVKGWPMSYTCFAWAEGRATLGSSPERRLRCCSRDGGGNLRPLQIIP